MAQPDVIIIGSGMGGATVAASLASSGRRILILERGDRLTPSPQDRDDRAVFETGHFRNGEQWVDGSGQTFSPGNYYCVGGNSKFYGAVLIRYRSEDFAPRAHLGGTTPGWPITYDDLEPWYTRAEALYNVRGDAGQDPTEPMHSGAYPYPPVPDEPDIARLRDQLSEIGLTPGSLPLGVDLETWLHRGAHPWDGFPDTCGGKMDAETVGLETALASGNVRLQINTRVVGLRADKTGRIVAVQVLHDDREETLCAPVIVLAAGAVQSAALLLGSAQKSHPTGLANRSDQVGRNFMNHNCSAVLALHPFRQNHAIYQKTLVVNDFYLGGGPGGAPLGNIQLLGKISGPILAAASPIPSPLANWIARRSFDFYAMSEDLPTPESRVSLKGGQVVLDWKRSNWETHETLVRTLKRSLRKAGFPIVMARAFDRRTPSHQCGTARMGRDPTTSVVDIHCRAHDHPNLYITDASVLPTSAAVNPALTVAALSMRAARHITEQEFAA